MHKLNFCKKITVSSFRCVCWCLVSGWLLQMVCVLAEGSFTSVVSGLISGGLRHVQFFDIVGFVLVVFVL